MNRLLLITLMLAGAAQVGAQQMPLPPPHDAGVPPSEALATIPNTSAAQQEEIRRILVQRRDAQEDLRTKMREQFDALHVKERNEHERIDAQASAQLRKLLGDDGYRAYAEWTVAHRGPHGMRPVRGGQPGVDRPLPPPRGPGAGHAVPSELDDE